MTIEYAGSDFGRKSAISRFFRMFAFSSPCYARTCGDLHSTHYFGFDEKTPPFWRLGAESVALKA
jgi:hypothetical protein